MAFNKYDMLSDVDTNTYKWNCRVRAQAIWKGISRETQKCFGINIIFLDDSNNRIHAFINNKFVDQLQEEIVEGQIYALSNFKVKTYLGDETFRAVRGNKHIYFTEHTKCIKDNNEGLEIESYAFDIFALEEIEKNADDHRFLFDVAGIVQNARPMISTTKNSVETKRLMFDISDGRYILKVTLFNEFGEAYEGAVLSRKDVPLPIIIVAAKITTYEGTVNLTNYPATRVYVNPQHYYVHYLKENDEEEEKKMKCITIQQVQALGKDFIQKRVSVQCSVKRLEEKSSWYYANCAKCKIELFREGGTYKCLNCRRTIPHPDKRFRVFTLCTDKTGSIGIIFPDSEVRRIIQKSVFDIHAEYTEEPLEEPFPEILRQLQHKDYIITLFLSEENIINGSGVYEATEVDNAIEKSDEVSPGNKISSNEQDMPLLKDKQTPIILKDTPQTAKSTNWKSRARKNTAPVQYDTDENVPTKGSKYIKTETGDITLRDLVNRLGHKNLQAKFSITNGSSNVNVTFWDALAKSFVEQLKLQPLEEPVIIIITSCKVGAWNDQVDLSNAAATTFYLNYQHHSVREMRKILANPNFKKHIQNTQVKKKAQLLKVGEIKKLGNDFIQVHRLKESFPLTICDFEEAEITKSYYISMATPNITGASADHLIDSDDELMKQIDEYKPDMDEYKRNHDEKIEKSLTNLNVNVSTMAMQLRGLCKSHEEYCANFKAQVPMMMEEIMRLNAQVDQLRKQINRPV
ncbi:hypothetical protein POM88_046211 [Heracleum sosnowskyi]|uniref:Replication protein A 70 kDa DNA-binding subunit B/D first OB fold domain-containing protein n=1 Tax=Heracleum sosnowskyi TaxID=360622 RepID=A0AAD8H8X5_9APIA|nr:hypothetical protein POM88_046211 [Heracleum sosnowskyi]